MAKIDRVIKEIVNILREDTRGLTIQELSLLTKVSRITTALALAKLEGANLIDVRVIGNCKLHYLTIKVIKKEKIII
jgi:DNA-binding Lrp family transcriptional regulator